MKNSDNQSKTKSTLKKVTGKTEEINSSEKTFNIGSLIQLSQACLVFKICPVVKQKSAKIIHENGLMIQKILDEHNKERDFIFARKEENKKIVSTDPITFKENEEAIIAELTEIFTKKHSLSFKTIEDKEFDDVELVGEKTISIQGDQENNSFTVTFREAYFVLLEFGIIV